MEAIKDCAIDPFKSDVVCGKRDVNVCFRLGLVRWSIAGAVADPSDRFACTIIGIENYRRVKTN